MDQSQNLFKVAFFLARFGQSNPPLELQSPTWKDAFDLFHPVLGNGQATSKFRNVLSNYRDHLAGHFPGDRKGWKDLNTGRPSHQLIKRFPIIFEQLLAKSRDEVWWIVSSFTASHSTYAKVSVKQDMTRTASVGMEAVLDYFKHPNAYSGEELILNLLTETGRKDVVLARRGDQRENDFRLFLKPARIKVKFPEHIIRFDYLINGDIRLELVSSDTSPQHHENLLYQIPQRGKTQQQVFEPGLSFFNQANSMPGPHQHDFADLFIGEELKEALQRSILRKKNIILQGPPGTGKTFIAKRLARHLGGSTEDGSIEMVQFHQSFGYEDFVMGYRPGENGFEAHEGIFFEFCRRAENDSETPHFLIIDEINRGNLSRILGELMVLIEHDKRGPEHALRLGRSKGPEDRFHVPENLHIIGTMNTADRSLGRVDYALRRRFHFHSIPPCFDTSMWDHLIDLGCPEGLASHVTHEMTAMNDSIAADPERDLGPGFEIGHSYFCDAPDDGDWTRWLEDIIDLELIPLLREYWYDKPFGDTEEFVEGLRNHQG